ncbi:MAG TPA: PDZ domain-containing protein [Pirellulaceae bacterium]|nr:PDZ domain-containing protein [Pirellulaceae bacterium]
MPIEIARDIRLRREPFVHREGETLGAELKPHVLGCEIVKVTAGSLAERMRLKPGDVIVGYKEDRTADPDALAAVLKAAKAGDEASLDYVRQANVLTRIVTLGEWE